MGGIWWQAVLLEVMGYKLMKMIALVIAFVSACFSVPALANDASAMRQMRQMSQAQRMMKSQSGIEMRRQERYEQDDIVHGRKSVAVHSAWQDDDVDEDEEAAEEEKPDKPYFHYVY